MTSALTNRDGVRDAVTAAASAVAALLPWPVVLDSAASDAAVVDLLPVGGAGRAVSLNMRGAACGELLLVLSDVFAEAVVDGPLGRQELVAALAGPLEDAGVAIERYCAAALQFEAAHEVQGAVALAGAGAGDGRLCGAVALRAGGEHIATLALLVEPAAAAVIPAPRGSGGAAAHDFLPLGGSAAGSAPARSLDLLHDVEMSVTAELGRTRMTVRDLLALAPGSVVELDRTAGTPVDLLVNGTLVARGEVVVVDEEFGIRVSEILGSASADGARTGPQRRSS